MLEEGFVSKNSMIAGERNIIFEFTNMDDFETQY